MAPRRGTSPWVYIGCGCLGCIALVVGGCLTLAYWGSASVDAFKENLQNPEIREAKIREILGADTLPEGLHGQLYLRIPLLLEMVLLSDGQPIEVREEDFERGGEPRLGPEELGDNAFVYLALRDFGDARRDLERLVDGESTDVELDVNLDFRSREVIGRGAFTMGDQEVRWVAHRGEFHDRGERAEGSYTGMLIDCPDRRRVRAAFLWRRLDPSAPEEGELFAFLEHFALCG